jgi:iron complex outermembrane receptor protein
VWAYNPVGSLSFVSSRAGAVLISYAHKSRFPTIKDRYSYKAGRAVPNPSLRPERARTWTGSYSRTFASRTVAQLDVFRSSVNDEIENIFFLSPLCPAGGGRGTAGTCQQAVNVGSEIHEGFTVTLRTTPKERLTIDANYSYLRREITGATGVFPTGTPKNKMVATATLRLPRDATALISTRYQDGTVAMSDNGLPLPSARFTTVDAGGTLPIRSSVSIQGGIKNLLDRDYYYWEGFPEPGRNWYLTLRYGFSRR